MKAISLIVATILVFVLNSLSQTNTINKDLSETKSVIKKIDIKINPPKHFKEFKEANGFVHPMTASTIQISEIKDANYISVCNNITDEYIKSQGFEFISKESIKTQAGKEGEMYLVSFVAKDVVFHRIMFFTGDYNRTIWINANYPKVAEKLLHNVLKESLLTIEF